MLYKFYYSWKCWRLLRRTCFPQTQKPVRFQRFVYAQLGDKRRAYPASTFAQHDANHIIVTEANMRDHLFHFRNKKPTGPTFWLGVFLMPCIYTIVRLSHMQDPTPSFGDLFVCTSAQPSIILNINFSTLLYMFFYKDIERNNVRTCNRHHLEV